MCTTNTIKSLNRQLKNICYDLDNKKEQNILLLLSWKVIIYKFYDTLLNLCILFFHFIMTLKYY